MASHGLPSLGIGSIGSIGSVGSVGSLGSVGVGNFGSFGIASKKPCLGSSAGVIIFIFKIFFLIEPVSQQGPEINFKIGARGPRLRKDKNPHGVSLRPAEAQACRG